MLSPEVLYPYSIPVARETVVKSGSLTSLPVRIHRHDSLADVGAKCLTGDWGRIMGDGQEKKSNGSPSVAGNWGSFIWPECLPDRLGLLSYLLDAGCLHDDVCEEMPIVAAHAEHLDLYEAMNFSDSRVLDLGSQSTKIKDLVSTVILECMRVDRVCALRMLEAYRKRWQAIIETRDTDKIESLEEYLESRANNGSMGAYYAMLEFSLGIVITQEEYSLLAAPMRHWKRCMLLTNDYWSWLRARQQTKNQLVGRVVNTIWFLIKQNPTYTDEQAKSKVAEMVVAEEAKWVQSKNRLYAENPKLRDDLVKFLENLHTALAGNDYWSSQRYRHNDWTHVPTQPEPDHPRIHELAGFGRTLVVEESRILARPSSSSSPSHSLGASASSSSGWASSSSQGDLSSPLSSASSTFDNVDRDRLKHKVTKATTTTAATAEEVISAPIRYIQSMPSKGFRAALVDCYNMWLDVPQPFFGQSLDLHWTFNRECPTKTQYFNMIEQKTGAFLSLVAELMMVVSAASDYESSTDSPENIFQTFSYQSGLYFQVRDDYLNITSADYADKKGFAEDLDEQKFSYILVHLAHSRPDLMVQVEGIFKAMRSGKTENAETKKYLVSLLHKSGAVEATKELLVRWQDDIVKEIDVLENHFGKPNPSLRLLMQTLWIDA
uniref:Geranylgeranyl pyrophosphate synthetase n=1 Tax=Pyricularia oryzae (strain P131) TaxID=1143193 RepID=L7JQ34_PYRO1